jgi:dTDP-4-dehydrorhamnose 3,5-epimerase
MVGVALQGNRIDGVVVLPLTAHHDARGNLVEIYREHWNLGDRPVQFNAVTNAAGVLRGVHAHVRHVDYLFVATGSMVLGLHDIRPWSPTAGASWQFKLDATTPRAVVIPPGVAHGFYFPEPSLHLYGVSQYWDAKDELGCAWNCPELGIAWPTDNPTLSERDIEAPDYDAFVGAFLQAWRHAYGAASEMSGP